MGDEKKSKFRLSSDDPNFNGKKEELGGIDTEEKRGAKKKEKKRSEEEMINERSELLSTQSGTGQSSLDLDSFYYTDINQPSTSKGQTKGKKKIRFSLDRDNFNTNLSNVGLRRLKDIKLNVSNLKPALHQKSKDPTIFKPVPTVLDVSFTGSSRGISVSGLGISDVNLYDQSEINLLLSNPSAISTASELSQSDSFRLTTSLNSLSLCPLTSQSDVRSESAASNLSAPRPERKIFSPLTEAGNNNIENLNESNNTTETGIENPDQSESRTFTYNSHVYVRDHDTPLIYDSELETYVPLQSGDKFSIQAEVHKSDEQASSSTAIEDGMFTLNINQQASINMEVDVETERVDEAIQVPSSNVAGPVQSDTAIVVLDQGNRSPPLHSVRSETCINSRLDCIEAEAEEEFSLLSPNESVPGDHDSLCELFIPLPTPETDGSPDREWIETESPILPKRRHSI